jgi:hypothetical protein
VSGPRGVSSSHTQYTGLVLLAALIGLLGAAGSIVFQAAIAAAARGFEALGTALAGALAETRGALAPAVAAIRK